VKSAAAAVLIAALAVAAPAAARPFSGGNLLANGTFDSSVSGWAGFNSSLAASGGAAVVTAKASGTVSIYPSPRPVTSTAKGTVYTAAATVSGPSGKTLCVQVREWASGAVGSKEACAAATGSWQQLGPVSYTTTAAGDSLEAYVYEKAGAKGDAYRVDEISLTDGSAPAPAPAPTPPPTPTPTPTPVPGTAVAVSPGGLQSALDAAQPGQTLQLHAGTYPDWVTASRSGTAAAPVTITAFPGEHPLFTGRLKISGSWTTLSNLHFVGGTAGNNSGVLLYVSGADHVSILGNEFDHANMSAMYLGDVGNGSDYATIAGNYIHDNGTHYNLDHGIYLGTGTNGTIVNNVITHNYARGIQCYPDCDNTLIANNTVVGSGRAGIQVGNENVSTSDNDTIVNNIVTSNGNTGIRSYWGGKQGTGIVASNNLVWGNSGGDTAGPGITFTGTLTADPLFVAASDFHLGVLSPARGIALTQYAPAVNYDGVPRGTLPNLGAF
jgi:parallel beta-helix repeat protein